MSWLSSEEWIRQVVAFNQSTKAGCLKCKTEFRKEIPSNGRPYMRIKKPWYFHRDNLGYLRCPLCKGVLLIDAVVKWDRAQFEAFYRKANTFLLHAIPEVTTQLQIEKDFSIQD